MSFMILFLFLSFWFVIGLFTFRLYSMTESSKNDKIIDVIFILLDSYVMPIPMANKTEYIHHHVFFFGHSHLKGVVHDKFLRKVQLLLVYNSSAKLKFKHFRLIMADNTQRKKNKQRQKKQTNWCRKKNADGFCLASGYNND